MKLKSEFNQAQIEVIYEGEHHMGAISINFVLDKKFRGVNKIRTTNGEAKFDKKSPYLIIYDTLMILIFDYNKNEVYHVFHGKGNYISKVTLNSGILSYQITSSDGLKNKYVVHLEKNKKYLGYGNASNGKMPSTYP